MGIRLTSAVLLTASCACCSLSLADHSEDGVQSQSARPIFGRSEYVYIAEFDQCFLAKIDTGAVSASINAVNISLDEGPGEGDDTVHFDLVLPDGSLKPFSLPVSKYIYVKRRAADIGKSGRGYNRRPAIKVDIAINGMHHRSVVNLADRRAFSRDMLIGARPLKAFGALVDVSAEKLQGECSKTNVNVSPEPKRQDKPGESPL